MFTFILKGIILLFQTIIFCIYTPLLSLGEYDILHFDTKLHIYVHILYLCIIFLVPLYGEGLYRLCLLPNPYYGLNIIKICLNRNSRRRTVDSCNKATAIYHFYCNGNISFPCGAEIFGIKNGRCQ